MTLLCASTAVRFVEVPLASPLQPRNSWLVSAAAVSATDWPTGNRFPCGYVLTRPRPFTNTASVACPALNDPNAHETVGFAFVTAKSSGLSVLITALPHAPK